MTSTEPNPATDPATTDPATTTAPEGQQEPATGVPEGQATPDGAEPRPQSEAAKYRTQLRATETERDTLAARVETLTRREAARHAAEVLAVGDDLFDVGRVDLADLFDAAGELDPVKVRAAAQTVARARPGLASTRAQLSQYLGGGGFEPSSSWSAILRGE